MLDVLVVGGGNAALCAALVAREAGASVMLLEAAPREWRGGNSMHTRNLRCMHDAPQDVLTDAYPEEEFWQDLLKVTAGKTDEALARLVIRESATVRPWMRRHGVRFQPCLLYTSEPEHINGAFCAKAGIHSWAKGLSRMVGKHGITVNCIPPGRIHSEQIFRNYTPEYRAWQSENEIPVGRYGEPGELADLVAFLASPRAGYISGAVIPVDGGLRKYQF